MMVGSWACRVSSEIRIGGRRVSEPVHDDKGKEKVTELGDEKDPKRACAVLSKGHEVVGSGYSRLLGAAAEVMHKGENSGNPNRVNRVSKTEQCYPSLVNQTDRVSQIGWDSRADQQTDRVSRVANTERKVVENSTSTGSRVTQGSGGAGKQKKEKVLPQVGGQLRGGPEGYYQDTKMSDVEVTTKRVGQKERGGGS
jgi:hypothetical protein